MLSRDLEKSLHRALALAVERRHEFATLEHLLYALLEDPDAIAVLKACGVDLERLERELETFINEELESLTTEEAVEAKPTTGFQRVVQRAVLHVQSSGRSEVTGANILAAIFSERESHAVYFLQEQDMSRYDAVNYISHRIAKVPGQSGPGGGVSGTDEDAREENIVKEGPAALDAYCVNLNAKANAGRIDPLIGRDAEIERTIQVLCRRTKNNPLYVGDAAWARRRLPRVSRGASNTARCRRCWTAPPSSRWTWARCSPAHATAATSRSVSRRCSPRSRPTTARSSSLTRFTRSSARVPPAAARWMRRTC